MYLDKGKESFVIYTRIFACGFCWNEKNTPVYYEAITFLKQQRCPPKPKSKHILPIHETGKQTCRTNSLLPLFGAPNELKVQSFPYFTTSLIRPLYIVRAFQITKFSRPQSASPLFFYSSLNFSFVFFFSLIVTKIVLAHVQLVVLQCMQAFDKKNEYPSLCNTIKL